MKIKIYLLIILFTTIFINHAEAYKAFDIRISGGNELGNGGDIFYCPQADGSKLVQLVDVYEAMEENALLDFGPANLSYNEKLQYILNKWATISPLRVAQYRQWLIKFETETLFKAGITLPNVPDEGILFIPKGCELQQVAIQLTDADITPSRKRFTINKDLWDQMTEDHKAALVLHEMIYREAIESDSRSSMRVRALNGKMLAQIPNIAEYFTASADLDGLYLEWSWGSIKKQLPVNKELNTFKKALLSKDAVEGHKLAADKAASAWIRYSDSHKLDITNCTLTLISNNTPYVGKDPQQYLFCGKGNALLESKVWKSWYYPAPYRIIPSIRLNQKSSATVTIGSNSIIFSNLNAYDIELATNDGKLLCTNITNLNINHKIYLNNDINNDAIIQLNSENGSGDCRLNTSSAYASEKVWKQFHVLKWKNNYYHQIPISWYNYDGLITRHFFVNGKNIECDAPADARTLFTCKWGIPAKLTCEIPVLDQYGDSSNYTPVEVNIKNVYQLEWNLDEKYPRFKFYLPKGQLIRYDWGLLQAVPVKLAEDTWLTLDFDQSSGCYLHHKKNEN